MYWCVLLTALCGGGGGGASQFSRALAHILNACLVTCIVALMALGGYIYVVVL